MSQVLARFELEGAREGEDFTPRNLRDVEFKGGVYEAVVNSNELPSLERVLLTYGARLVSLGGKPRGSMAEAEAEAEAEADEVSEENDNAEASEEDEGDVQSVPEPDAEKPARGRRGRRKAKAGGEGVPASEPNGESSNDGEDQLI